MKSSVAFVLAASDALFISNSTTDFKMKYPNLGELLQTTLPGIDHGKVLSYGCNCQFLDGRPLASASGGHPVDALDAACKQFRECQKCVQMDDGADCNRENVDWLYDIDLKVPQLECLDPVKNCRRHLCECDREFALAVAENFKFYDPAYAQPNFDKSICHGRNNGIIGSNHPLSPNAVIDMDNSLLASKSGEIFSSEARCCGRTTGPKKLYNMNKQECCSLKKKEYHLTPVGRCEADLVETRSDYEYFYSY